MTNSLSLRARLTVVILAPLLLIAGLIGAWAFSDAEANASERFDRSLLSTALAISRDTAVTGGDALSEVTRDLLRDTSGGAVFYHVYAPDGVFVTGYATPPVPPANTDLQDPQVYFDAVYQGAPVRALRFTQNMLIDGLNGPFTFTVWQDTDVRDGFLQSRTRPTFLIIASMIGALGLVVWFGVRFGLSPLLDLEEAISQRSPADLSTIKRRIPPEVSGIVSRLNMLLADMSKTLKAKDEFISDAAHQLRNPIAGVLSLADSLQGAKTLADAKQRGADVQLAAREAGNLANDLLTLERAKADPRPETLTDFDAVGVLQDLSKSFEREAKAAGIDFAYISQLDQALLYGDPVMFRQAILNILTNALAHGGDRLSEVNLAVNEVAGGFQVTVTDDGKGLAKQDFGRALGRFSQIGPSAGSGLGLPIAEAVAQGLGGSLSMESRAGNFVVVLEFPAVGRPSD